MNWFSSMCSRLLGPAPDLAASGLPVLSGPPAELGSFDLVGGRGEFIASHVCVRAFPAIALYAVRGGPSATPAYRLAWFSGACQGALVLRLRERRGKPPVVPHPSLSLLDAASLPPPFADGLDVLVDLTHSAKLFTSTAVGGVFLQLKLAGRPWEFAYENGWARLIFPASQLSSHAGYRALLATAELLDQALQTPEEAVPEEAVAAAR